MGGDSLSPENRTLIQAAITAVGIQLSHNATPTERTNAGKVRGQREEESRKKGETAKKPPSTQNSTFATSPRFKQCLTPESMTYYVGY